MSQLLVNTPSGEQQLIAVGLGGRYHDEAQVLWDERLDGAFPGDKVSGIGGWKRQGDDLVSDSATQSAHDAAVAAEAAKGTADQARRDAIKDVANANSVAALKVVVQNLVEHLGLD